MPSKSIIKSIMKDMKSSIEPEKARNFISSQKSRGVTAEKYYAEQVSNSRNYGLRTQASLLSLEMAQIYL